MEMNSCIVSYFNLLLQSSIKTSKQDKTCTKYIEQLETIKIETNNYLC